MDLSLFNLQMAEHQLGGLGGVTFAESNAEHMAIENESQDVVTCNFVLSSMPPEAQVRAGCARSLGGKSGGRKPKRQCLVFDMYGRQYDLHAYHPKYG